MSAQQLPPRPDLDQLKHQAKDLLHSAERREPGARARFRVLPAFASAADNDLDRAALALHDAQSVIAREYGFDSWKTLREHAEELTLEFDAAVGQFLEAATDASGHRAERILGLHPGIASANFHTALVLGDAKRVEARLDQDPSLATKPGGPRGWEPIHYVCYSAVAHDSPERAAGLAAITKRLIALGVDPNTRFPWLHHNVRRPVLWGASRVARSMPLVAALLDAGADPNDGVTLPMAASAGDIPVLEALLAHGAKAEQAWATDGATSLYAILNWSHTPDGAIWLLEHGADPNAVFAENGETPLHAVARAWDVPLAEAMVAHGADIARKRTDGRTPYAVAELNGNRAVADWLLAQGASPELAAVDRLVAACSRGDRATVDKLLAANPALRSEITDDHYISFHQAAERNDVPALEAMLACGFDPNRPDSGIGKTALHSAAMAGWPDAVRVLLAHGASVTIRDREFNGTPLIWAAEGSRTEHRQGRDFASVGKLLLDAGSPVEWEYNAEPADGLREIVAAWQKGR
ncbi:MAG TPA: ankyrin repeat domain-containing protein [Gemmatimonadales bacterium]|nr:ankyrin repeat domain-containing protein [Gemmatimonadales bacterium]